MRRERPTDSSARLIMSINMCTSRSACDCSACSRVCTVTEFLHLAIMTQTQGTAVWQGRALCGVLFDLDGTLLDTVSDIARALNRTLSEHGLAPLPIGDVSRMIGRGSPMLIESAARARSRELSDGEKAAMLERFFHHYGEMEEKDESDAQPYAGVCEALRCLHDARLWVTVVTTKYHRF